MAFIRAICAIRRGLLVRNAQRRLYLSNCESGEKPDGILIGEGKIAGKRKGGRSEGKDHERHEVQRKEAATAGKGTGDSRTEGQRGPSLGSLQKTSFGDSPPPAK